MKFRSTIFLLLATISIGCSKSANMGNDQDRKPDLVVISTNDIHSNIDRIPKLATLTNRLRAEGNVLLIDSGDRQNGNALVDYADQPGQPIIELMNKLGYYCATIGEHEFDYGQETLANNIKHATFNIVCANISGSDILPEFAPYATVELDNKLIVVMGLINTDKATHRPPVLENKLNNLEFEDPLVTARQFKSLGTQADLFILLSHCGTYTDSLISTVVPQINLIAGGGSHEVIFDQKEINGVVVTQAGNGLKYATITKIWFNGSKRARCESSLVELDKLESDQEFTMIVNDIKSQKDFSKVIGKTSTVMDKNAIASLLCKSMINNRKINYALYNLDGINRDSHDIGNITLEDLYNIEPYKYQYYNLILSIGTLKEIIIQEYNSRKIKDRKKTLHLENMDYKLITDSNANLIDVAIYINSTLIKNDAGQIGITVNEYIYIKYNHLLEISSRPLGSVTDAVIDYLKEAN